MHQRPLGAVACCPLYLLTRALLGDVIAFEGPINAADVNALAVLSKEGGVYTEKRIVGYSVVGTCPVCNTALAVSLKSEEKNPSLPRICSRMLMGCFDLLLEGGEVTHQCPLDAVPFHPLLQ